MTSIELSPHPLSPTCLSLSLSLCLCLYLSVCVSVSVYLSLSLPLSLSLSVSVSLCLCLSVSASLSLSLSVFVSQKLYKHPRPQLLFLDYLSGRFQHYCSSATSILKHKLYTFDVCEKTCQKKAVGVHKSQKIPLCQHKKLSNRNTHN